MGAGVRDAFPPPMCKCITEIGRGGACVPARVAPQGRIHRYPPRIMRVFLDGNAAARTFGRAHRCRPYAFRLGGLGVGRLVSFGQIARWRLISFGWIVCKWLFCLCGKILRGLVGAAPVCPPVSPCRGAFVVHSPHMICDFCMETPLRGRPGGHTGAAPTVSFGQIACGQLVSFGGLRVGRLVSFGWIACVVLFVGKTVHMNQHHRCCTFVSPGLIEHSEIYPG